MAGGIQEGTEAGSEESKRLDGDVKNVAEAIAQAQVKYFYEFGHKNMMHESYSEATKKSNALPELTKMGITLGCIPDGGMWFDGDRSKQGRKIIAGFEAKHQQDGGNAIERWCKNYMLCKGMNPNVKYVTFMSGQGAQLGGVLHNFGDSMVNANGPNCIFYYSPEGFSQEGIFNIMISILGLDLKFEDIKPFLTVKYKSNFDEHFVIETEEQRKARLDEANARYQSELAFAQFSKDPADPLYPVWHRLPKAVKADAHTIVIDMLQEGKANAVIATELVECFLNN